MKYSLENNKIFFNHIMLHSENISASISKTDKWKVNEELEAKIEVNGIEIPAEIVQDFFEDLYKRMTNHLEDKLSEHKKLLESRYADLDKEADRRVRKIIKTKANKTLKAIFKAERIVKAIINESK